MRKLTFTNSNGVSIVLGDPTYPITKLEGLGAPGLSNQSQKAPFQDGSTWIDTLLNNREIVVQGQINKPKDLATQMSLRDTMLRVFNPKLGPGILLYEYDGGSKQIQALCSIVFSNKEANVATQPWQIQFTCFDPYWQDTVEDSIALPTAVNSGEVIISGPPSSSSSSSPSVIQLTNGNLFIVYKRNTDGYLVSRTYTTSWSSESVINSGVINNPSVIQLANGNLYVVYQKGSNNIVSRTYTTSWSSESDVSVSSSSYPSVIQLANGNLFIVYIIGSLLVSRTYTTSWSSESTINSASSLTPSVIQLTNGNLFIVYRRNTDGYLVSRTYTTSWSSENIVNSSSSSNPSIIELDNKSLFIVFQRYSDNYIVSRTYTTSWSSESVIKNIYSFSPSAIQLSSGDLFIAYRNESLLSVASITRSVTPVNASNDSHVPVPVQITFNGPATNPRIIKQSTLEQIRVNLTLATGDTMEIDTTFGQKTLKLTQGGIVKNGLAFLDLSSTFFDLDEGNNTVYFEDDSELSTATATMKWRGRYIGV